MLPQRHAGPAAPWEYFLFCILLSLALPGCHALFFRGLTFSPFANNPGTMCQTPAQLQPDLDTVLRYTSRLRLYSISNCPGLTNMIMQAAHARGATVLLGLWIGTDAVANEQEFAALPGLLQAWGNTGVINGIAVGNEAITIHGVQLADLLESMKRVRSMVSPYAIPITIVETAGFWSKAQDLTAPANQLLPLVDFVGAVTQPFFDGLPATCVGLNITGCYEAASWAVNRVLQLKRLLGKRVECSEVGWPSQGESCCNYRPFGFPSTAPMYLAVPSPANSDYVMKQFWALAEAANISYYYFEPFDSDWKRVWAPCTSCSRLGDQCVNNQCQYEYFWGMLGTKDKQPKAGIDPGPGLAAPSLSPPPHLSPSTSRTPSPRPSPRPSPSPPRPSLSPSPRPSPSPSNTVSVSPPHPAPRPPRAPGPPRPPPKSSGTSSPSPAPSSVPSPLASPPVPPPSSPPPRPPSPVSAIPICPSSPCPVSGNWFHCTGLGSREFNGCLSEANGPWADLYCSAQCLVVDLTVPPSPHPPSPLPPSPSPSPRPPPSSPPPQPRPPSPVSAIPTCLSSPCSPSGNWFHCTGVGSREFNGCLSEANGPWADLYCSAQCLSLGSRV